MVEELDRKAEELAERHPELIRPKVVKTLYAMWIAEEALEEAKERRMWVLRATKELTPLPLSSPEK